MEGYDEKDKGEEVQEVGESTGSGNRDDSHEQTWGDRMLIERDELSPRHRKLAELAAQGISQGEIARSLSYTPSRVSILLSNTRIKAEVARISERIYQETVGKRLKALTEPALNEIEKCLTDQTRRYKENLKVDTAKWVVEMDHGKAKQTSDIGENLLSVMMDRLDRLKDAGKTMEHIIDVTPQQALPAPQETTIEQKAPPDEDEQLRDWVTSFT